MIRVVPGVVAAAVAGVDGYLNYGDDTVSTTVAGSPQTRTQAGTQHQHSTWLEAAALVGGILADQTRMLSRDISESMTLTGLALLARKGGYKVAANGQTPKVTGVPFAYAPMETVGGGSARSIDFATGRQKTGYFG